METVLGLGVCELPDPYRVSKLGAVRSLRHHGHRKHAGGLLSVVFQMNAERRPSFSDIVLTLEGMEREEEGQKAVALGKNITTHMTHDTHCSGSEAVLRPSPL